MARLSALGLLDEEKLSVLAQSRIFSVEDVLRVEAGRLSSVIGRGREAVQLKSSVLLFPPSRPLSSSQPKLLPTGIEAIDSLTGGGLETGCLAEVCGASGSGKSRIVFAIVAHSISRLRRRVVYIDTKGDFSARRLARLVPDENNLQRIQLFQLSNAYELLTTLRSIEADLKEKGRLGRRLLVIDSMAAPFLQLLGNSNCSSLLIAAHQLLRKIGLEYDLCILVTNLFLGGSRPALGPTWTQAPTHRFVLVGEQITLTSAANCLESKTVPFVFPPDPPLPS